ncbi:MAG: membrane protein [Rhodanobacteraceae bacterium]
MPTPRLLLTLAALLGALAVALGAFGAHALRDTLDASALALWRTAVDYLFWHVLAALFAARYAESTGARGAGVAALLLLCGAAVFASTLFALALGAPRQLGAVTPLGGAAMIVGWLTLAWAVFRQR